MFKTKKVKRIGYTSLYDNGTVITYEDDDGIDKYAACSEDLAPTVRINDMVEIYLDTYFNYKGFGAIALKTINPS